LKLALISALSVLLRDFHLSHKQSVTQELIMGQYWELTCSMTVPSSRGSSVSVETRLQGWTTGGQFLAGAMVGCFSSPPRADWLGGPPSFLSNVFRG